MHPEHVYRSVLAFRPNLKAASAARIETGTFCAEEQLHRYILSYSGGWSDFLEYCGEPYSHLAIYMVSAHASLAVHIPPSHFFSFRPSAANESRRGAREIVRIVCPRASSVYALFVYARRRRALAKNAIIVLSAAGSSRVSLPLVLGDQDTGEGA